MNETRASWGMSMKSRIVVLGAGFGGLELSTLLSELLGDSIEVTLIDKSESFLFGYSKLDVMFGRATLDVAAPAVPPLRQTGRALCAANNHRDRSRQTAYYHRLRHLRGRFPDRSTWR